MLSRQAQQQLPVLMAAQVRIVALHRVEGRAANRDGRVGQRNAVAEQKLPQCLAIGGKAGQSVYSFAAVRNVAEAVDGTGDVGVLVEECDQPVHTPGAEGVVRIEKSDERCAGQCRALVASLVGSGRYRYAAPFQAHIVERGQIAFGAVRRSVIYHHQFDIGSRGAKYGCQRARQAFTAIAGRHDHGKTRRGDKAHFHRKIGRQDCHSRNSCMVVRVQPKSALKGSSPMVKSKALPPSAAQAAMTWSSATRPGEWRAWAR